MRKLVKWSFGVLAGIYLIGLLALFVVQRSLVFAPNPTRVQLVESNLPGVEEVVLESEQAKQLICWYGPAEEGQPTLLYFHGNGGNVGTRGEMFRQWMAKGYGVFMVGYPGYGGSDGSPSEPAFMEAAHTSYDHLQDQGISANDIVICGQSLGTCVATQLASQTESRALVLLAPMKSVMDMAGSEYPFIPMTLLLRDPFRSDLHIKHVEEPLLVVHGGDDQVIPIGTGRSLYELGNTPKHFETIKGAGHNDLYDFPIVESVDSFLSGLSRDRTAATDGSS